MPDIVTTFEDRAGGRIARVVIDNRAKLNVLNSALSAALEAAFRRLAADDTLRAVVLAGAGTRALIGGADIREMAGLTPATARAFITQLHNVCSAIRALPVPVIARMQGYCLGGGLEVAAACDMRIASDDAVMGMPEVRVGIPSVIEAALLPRLIGWGRTRRILMTGETFDAAKALAWGMVEEVVPAAELDAAIDRVLADLLAGAPHAIRLQKSLIAQWEERGIAGAIAAGIDSFAEAWTTPEPARRMADFLADNRKG
ncbi:MAG: enoyl-CoA hydratase/isomerase family protein [Acetobacteraceae bacterium]|nr:enoyl-CoA hydratase/isomerase family protein [Acetobacteraceae bacterium]